jgi:hypothetical protein
MVVIPHGRYLRLCPPSSNLTTCCVLAAITTVARKGVLDGLFFKQIFAASRPVVVIFLFGMAILWAFPAIITWLPRYL